MKQAKKNQRPGLKKHRFFSMSFLHGDDNSKEIKQVNYKDSNHFSVFFQMYGSVWPQVIWYCIANSVITTVLWYFVKILDYPWSVDPIGHKFMGVLVSFLLIGRLKIIYSRFTEARAHLSDIFRSCRELMHYAIVLTMHDKERDAANWRRNVAFRTIVLLRVTIASLEFNSSGVKPWELNDLEKVEQEALRSSLNLKDEEKDTAKTNRNGEETLRAPFILAFELRKEIMQQRNNKDLNKRFFHRHPCNEEFKILEYVNTFLSAYHELKRLIETPYPFPLIQMARTFLFAWVFTIPLALLDGKYDFYEVFIVGILLTYGFVGLERVSIEMEDPFGNDENDLDEMGLAQTVFEDIYIALCKCDGIDSAYLLRKKIVKRIKAADPLTNFKKNHTDGILSKKSFISYDSVV